MRTVAIIVVAAATIFVLASWWVSRPLFDEPLEHSGAAFSILPTDEAITLAMAKSGAVFLVLATTDQSASVVDLNRQLNRSYPDTLAAFAELGFTGLAAATGLDTSEIPLEQLGTPLNGAYPHVAAGTNFRAHAEEVGLDGEPFLFPKLSHARSWDATVPTRTRLDYEVEICAVTLAPHSNTTPAPLGFVLCNDYTDRWTLLRQIDLDLPMGQSGFPAAKGGEGMLTIGPFLVIPRDDRTFHADLQMTLGVNGSLRQKSNAGLMIWTPHEVLDKALATCDARYLHPDGEVQLTGCDAIAPGTLVLTGTPEGVLFHFVNIWTPLAYLGVDDEVVAFADHLGQLRNQIQPQSK